MKAADWSHPTTDPHEEGWSQEQSWPTGLHLIGPTDLWLDGLRPPLIGLLEQYHRAELDEFWSSRDAVCLSEVGGLFDAVEGNSAWWGGQRRGACCPTPKGVTVLPTNPALPDSRPHLCTETGTGRRTMGDTTNTNTTNRRTTYLTVEKTVENWDKKTLQRQKEEESQFSHSWQRLSALTQQCFGSCRYLA